MEKKGLLFSCQYCGNLNRLDSDLSTNAYCAECGSNLWRAPAFVEKFGLALTLGAMLLYIPANVFPILSVTRMGQYSENTIISGTAELIASGMWGIGIVVFLASVVVPMVKIICLCFLHWAVHSPLNRRLLTKIHKVMHVIGPWSMLDVFLVAILISLVKLGDLVEVSPGPGLIAFTAVVVFTTLATQLFDPRYLWLNSRFKQRDREETAS